ncbi:MAG: hypothetical protein AAB275_01330 [Deltaproteobacteria bacterium]
MKRNVFLMVLLISLVIPALAWAHAGNVDVVDVRVLSDSGGEFPK